MTRSRPSRRSDYLLREYAAGGTLRALGATLVRRPGKVDRPLSGERVRQLIRQEATRRLVAKYGHGRDTWAAIPTRTLARMALLE